MLYLPATLAAWNTPAFEAAFKGEIAQLRAEVLPLQAVRGSHVVNSPISAMLLEAEQSAGILRIRAGIFFSSVIAGCSCADDPTPVDELSEYGKLRFEIRTPDAATRVSLEEDSA